MLHEASQLENKKIKTFTLLKVIGSGAFSVVLEGVDNRDGSRVAVKAIPRYLIDKNSKTTELIGT